MTQTTSAQLKEIREAVVVSGIMWWAPDKRGEETERTIRLADLLFALAWHGREYRAGKGMNVADFTFAHDGLGWSTWNLRQDRLEDQSPECIDFVYSLIKKV